MQSKRVGLRVGLLGFVALVVAVVAPGVSVVQAQQPHVAVPSAPSLPRGPALGAQESFVRARPSVAQPEPKRRLRRLRRADLSTAMMLASTEVVKASYGKRFGTEVALEIEGKAYVARIERHFHPEGGAIKPWGYHPGVSLFAVR